MSVIANALLNLAESVANSRDSGLAVRIRPNGEVEKEFVSKSGTDRIVWENHYKNTAFYLGESAQPVKWDFDLSETQDRTVVSALDNAVTTKYYETFMQQEALSRIFNISGPQQDLIIKLLYAILAGIGIVAMLVMAVYGG